MFGDQNKYRPMYRIQGVDVINLDGTSTPLFLEDNEVKYVDRTRTYAKVDEQGRLMQNGEYTRMRIIEDLIVTEAVMPSKPTNVPRKRITDKLAMSTLQLELRVA
jgi:hypothetical protein